MAVLEKENKKIQREELIQFLAENLYNILQLKILIKDAYLRNFHLSAKAIGDDIFFLTVGFYQKHNFSTRKYNMTDYISSEAQTIVEAGKVPTNTLVFEHMVPKNIYIEKFRDAALKNAITQDFIYKILEKYYYTCTVKVEEDKVLGRAYIDEKFFEDNPFYRYKSIKYIENPYNFKIKDEK